MAEQRGDLCSWNNMSEGERGRREVREGTGRGVGRAGSVGCGEYLGSFPHPWSEVGALEVYGQSRMGCD